MVRELKSLTKTKFKKFKGLRGLIKIEFNGLTKIRFKGLT